MNEDRVNQPLAAMAEQHGELDGAKSSECSKSPSTVATFPRPMRRGPKVRRGPCAQILYFPVQLSGEDLDGRFRWMLNAVCDWDNEETDGVDSPHSERDRILGSALDAILGRSPPTDVEKRQRIAEGRKLIERRNGVKDWLEGIGANLDEITTPEQALFFVFDRLEMCKYPPSA